MNRFVLCGLLTVVALPALPCTCLSSSGSTAKTVMNNYPVVFRGSVLERKALPQRTEMKGRRRYAITFRVDEYWKRSSDRTRTLYGIDDGTDCLGGSTYEAGKNYLVYAVEQVSKDQFLGDVFWFGWTDIVPEGTQILVPAECTPSGETKVAAVRAAFVNWAEGALPEPQSIAVIGEFGMDRRPGRRQEALQSRCTIATGRAPF